MFCKTIILSNSENISTNAPKGILTLSKDNSYITGKIRLYNLLTLPSGAKVGLYVDNSVQICTLNKKQNYYEFAINENIDIGKNIYCAIIDTNNNKQVLLEGGYSNGFCFSDSPSDAVLEAKDENLEQVIDMTIKSSENCKECDCLNCEYKKYFYEHHSSSNDLSNSVTEQIEDNLAIPNPIEQFQQEVIENLQDEVIESLETLNNDINSPENNNIDTINNLNNDKKLEFLNDMVYQLDDMFNTYPADDVLNKIIPDSKFIRVDDENPYVLGIIYENNIMKFIAYGVPAQYNDLPPNDFGQHYQWLPLNPHDTLSDGYFMIYQDATNGNIVEINFEE